MIELQKMRISMQIHGYGSLKEEKSEHDVVMGERNSGDKWGEFVMKIWN